MEVKPRSGAGAEAGRPPTRGLRHGGPFLRGAPPVRARPWPTLIALAALGLVALVASSLLGENGWRSYQRLRRERAALATEVDSLRLRQRDLTRSIKDLRTDPAALERLAREKYSMHGEGEEIIEVVGEENLEGKVPVAPPAGDRPKLGTPPPPTRGKRAADTAEKTATAKPSSRKAVTAPRPAAAATNPGPAAGRQP